MESSNPTHLPKNNAAACFPRGFFDALGTQFPGTRLSKRVSIADAYDETARAFHQGGYHMGDPKKHSKYPIAVVKALPPVGDSGAELQYEVILNGRSDTVMGVAADATQTFAVGVKVRVASSDEAPVRLVPFTVHGTPGLLKGDPEHSVARETSVVSEAPMSPRKSQAERVREAEAAVLTTRV